jgi:putative transport protein
MKNWLQDLLTGNSIAHAIIIFAIVIAAGIWLGRLKIKGISLGVTWVLFAGLFLSSMGISVDESTEHFVKELGLILFVYAIGLQVGPGFFASLRQNALQNNLLALLAVLTGVLLTIALWWVSKSQIGIMAGIMSGAVTNTPGLAAAQAAAGDLHITGTDKSFITLAYAVAYPFGVFGIIAVLVILKNLFRINIGNEQELHRRLYQIRSNKPVSTHFNLQNKMLIGQPLHKLFNMLKERIVVSRMLQNGEVITPTPETVLCQNDVLLIVASKKETEQLKLIVGSISSINLKTAEESNLIARTITVTKKSVTHRRLGDLPEINQQNFTLTRLSRAGIEIVPHGDIFLQLGDRIKVVGTEDGVKIVAAALGNAEKKLEAPDLAPIFFGISLGVVLGSLPIHFPGMPVAVKIGIAGGPLIVALLLSRFGNVFYLNNYTTHSANLMIRELGISLFLAAVGLSSGKNLSMAFEGGKGWMWMLMGITITTIPLLITGIVAKKYGRKTYFEICGLLAGASTDPPALAFATKMAGSDIPSVTYATVYPVTMILRIVAAQLLIVLFS